MILGILADDILYFDERFFDPVYVLLIAGGVYLFIYGYGMMDIYELLVDNEARYQKKRSYDYIYYVFIGSASVIYIAFGMLYGGIVWKSGWALIVVAALLAYGIVYFLENKRSK